MILVVLPVKKIISKLVSSASTTWVYYFIAVILNTIGV